MAPAKKPIDAIHEMLAEELRRFITALPDDLKEAVPEQLWEETELDKGETDK